MTKRTHNSATVLGLGSSGRAAACLLAREGIKVTVVDGSESAELALAAEELSALGITVNLNMTSMPEDAGTLCIVSPGVTLHSEWLNAARGQGMEILSELEIAWSRCSARTLAITGSNGKSTMAKLCAEALCKAGLSAVPCGNYGRPLSDVVLSEDKLDWAVVEVSSFQLETIDEFRPDTGVLLNVSPNHLDRHGDMTEYMRLKKRLFENMTEDETAVVPPAYMAEHLQDTDCKITTFGAEDSANWMYRQGAVECRGAGISISVKGTWFDNRLLGQTAAAAAAAIQACGVDPACVGDAAAVFQPLAHRFQSAGESGGIRFVNDSKATTLAAMACGVELAGQDVRLIAGGLLKEKNFESIKDLLASRVACVYLIGQAEETLAEAWGDSVRCIKCGDLKSAVETAWNDAADGDTILLSPGCASFDQYSGFKDRGQRFTELVKALEK